MEKLKILSKSRDIQTYCDKIYAWLIGKFLCIPNLQKYKINGYQIHHCMSMMTLALASYVCISLACAASVGQLWRPRRNLCIANCSPRWISFIQKLSSYSSRIIMYFFSKIEISHKTERGNNFFTFQCQTIYK